MNSIQMFEMILNSGTRTTTYKFGLLTGLVDYVIENPLEPPRNNFHFIPLFYLTKQFLAYYFPLVVKDIRQGPDIKNKSPTKIRNLLIDFYQLNQIQQQLSFPLDIDTTNLLISFINFDQTLPKSLIKLLFDIRKIVIDQPLQYIRNVKDEQISLFGLLSTSDSFQSAFETHRKTGLQLKYQNIKGTDTWNDLLSSENLHLFFSHQTFQEISEMRFWLRDVLIKRWAQECIERFGATEPNLLSLFDIWKKVPQRDNAVISAYRLLYQEKGLQLCTYCNQSITKNLQIDHLFPWSIFPVNSFWNLYPVCSSCNAAKSDRIPIITDKIENRIVKHLDLCLRITGDKQEIISKDIFTLYRSRFHSSPKGVTIERKVEEILEYIRHISTNLLETKPGYGFV